MVDIYICKSISGCTTRRSTECAVLAAPWENTFALAHAVALSNASVHLPARICLLVGERAYSIKARAGARTCTWSHRFCFESTSAFDPHAGVTLRTMPSSIRSKLLTTALSQPSTPVMSCTSCTERSCQRTSENQLSTCSTCCDVQALMN